MCDYMNKCNGNGACDSVSGQCTCNAGWKGADCAGKSDSLAAGYTKRFTTNGTQYLHFTYSKGVPTGYSYEFILSSSQRLDVYVSAGINSDPNELNYDLAFRSQTYLKLTSDDFPNLTTFSIQVKVNGIEFYSNVFHKGLVSASFNFVKLSQAFTNDVEIETEPLLLAAQAINEPILEDS